MQDYTRVVGGACTWDRLTRSIGLLYDFFQRNFGTFSGSQMQGGGNVATTNRTASSTTAAVASAGDKREIVMRYSDLVGTAHQWHAPRAFSRVQKARELAEQTSTSRSLPEQPNRGVATQHNRCVRGDR